MMKKIRRTDGTYILILETGPYHVVSKDIDPYNAFDIAELDAEYAANPSDFGNEQDELELTPLWKREANARALRNQWLVDTDWTQMPDIPEATRLAYQSYRQALRDVPNQPGFPDNIVWPEGPNFLEVNNGGQE